MKFKVFIIMLLTMLFIPTNILAVDQTSGVTATNQLAPPNLTATAAISIDADTNEIIYAKNIDEKRYPASITKLLTAMILAQHYKPTDNLKYGEIAKAQPAYDLRESIPNFTIKVGDTMTADDVMKALLLYSANDTAGMVADNISGNLTAFQKLMNDEASKLGMKDSDFVTPNGLHDDDHYSTAYDIALLTKAAFSYDWIKNTVALKRATISVSNGSTAEIDNRNELLGIDGNIGGKTGFTDEAGRCLTCAYNKDERTIIAVVLNTTEENESPVLFENMTNLINYSYTVKPTDLYAKDTVVKTVKLHYKLFKYFGPERSISVPLKSTTDLSYYPNDVNTNVKPTVTVNSLDPWNLNNTTDVGNVSISPRDDKKESKLFSTVTTSDIINSNKNTYLLAVIFGFFGAVSLIFLLIVAFVKAFKGKNKLNLNKNF